MEALSGNTICKFQERTGKFSLFRLLIALAAELSGKVEIFMIRGVSKNIIEISNTGNDSFERAILFVRADRPHSGGDLTEQAREYMDSLKLRRRFFQRHGLFTAVAALLSAILGCALTSAFFLLL